MKKCLGILALTLGFASVSQASILLEPYLGYESGHASATATGGADASGNNTDTRIGARIAYELPAFVYLGIDGSVASGSFKPANAGSEDTSLTNVYAFVGVKLPIFFRVWAGYGFVDNLDLKTDNYTFKGNSTKVGLGFTGLPFINLNLEYVKDDFTNVGSSTAYTAFSHYSYIASVSMPFSF